MAEHVDRSEQDQQESLPRLTTDIVSAFVANNTISPLDVANLINAIAKSLAELGQEKAPPVKPEPVVPVRRSVARDYLICLVCGKRQKLLKRHLATEHDLAPGQYRDIFDLKSDYPMVAPNYAQQRAELARKIGLGKPSRWRGRKRAAGSRLAGDPTTKP